VKKCVFVGNSKEVSSADWMRCFGNGIEVFGNEIKEDIDLLAKAISGTDCSELSVYITSKMNSIKRIIPTESSNKIHFVNAFLIRLKICFLRYNS
jgi:hypothetical protein